MRANEARHLVVGLNHAVVPELLIDGNRDSPGFAAGMSAQLLNDVLHCLLKAASVL